MRVWIFRSVMSLTLISQGAHAYFADANPDMANPHLLSKAIKIQITPRGMTYFEKDLGKVLGNMGINVDEGYFPSMTYTMDKPINPDDYASTNPQAVGQYRQLIDMLSTWLVGFSLNPHLLAINIGESGYVAQFSRFALVTDPNLIHLLGKQQGAVLTIELEIKKLSLSTDSILAWDINNEFLGKTGLEAVQITVGDQDIPLRMRLPFYIYLNENNSLQFQALDFENNLEQTSIQIQYQKLVVPTFAVEVNGKKFFLNNKEVDKLFSSQAPIMIEKVRANLKDFTTKTLPALLNKKLKQYLTGTLEQVQNMSAPGADPGDTRPDLKWGIRLQNLTQSENINIDLQAYVEDIINPRSMPAPQSGSRGEVQFDDIPTDKYDIALSLDRAMINRVMQLSFERKNFERIESSGTILKLVEAPTIDFSEPLKNFPLSPKETFIKLHVAVENRPESVFLQDVIVLRFDIIAKLTQIQGKEGLQLVLLRINENSMRMNPKYLSVAGKMLNQVWRDKVYDEIRNNLRVISAPWSKYQTNIPGSLPLPPNILGINLEINLLQMDPTGHLVMYLNYPSEQKSGLEKPGGYL